MEIAQLQELAEAVRESPEFNPETTDALTRTEEETQHPNYQGAEGEATAVEHKEIKDVNSAEPASMDFYLDGRQKTVFIGHVEDRQHDAYLPLHLHLSGAVTVNADQRIHHGPITWEKSWCRNSTVFHLRWRLLLRRVVFRSFKR